MTGVGVEDAERTTSGMRTRWRREQRRAGCAKRRSGGERGVLRNPRTATTAGQGANESLTDMRVLSDA